MPRRHDQHQRIVAKGQGLQMLAGGGGGNDADIRRTLGNGLDDTQARQLLDVEGDGRVVGEKAGEQFREVFAQGRGVAQQPYLALQALSVLAQVELQALDLLADQARMLQQGFACGRRLHATAITLQQGRTEGGFHGADPRTGGR
ncbi:hypothetical protein D3C84_778230 [compost metagenome]